MLILKRLIVWSLETVCEFPLFIALLILLSGPSVVRVFDLQLMLFGTTLFMVGSGYVLTTACVGLFFRSSVPWTYPAIHEDHEELLKFLLCDLRDLRGCLRCLAPDRRSKE